MSDEPPLRPPPLDDYERRYMDGERAVLRVRRRSPPWVLASMGATTLLSFAYAVWVVAWFWRMARSPGDLAAFAVVALFAGLMAAMSALNLLTVPVTRVVLTGTHLRVHRALHVEDIPLDAVTGASVEEVGWFNRKASFLGSLTQRERMFAEFGMREALRVAWRDDRGRERVTWVHLAEAGAFRDRIEALRAAPTGVRVEAGDEREAAGEGDAANVAEGRAARRLARPGA